VKGRGESGLGDAARKRVAVEMIAQHERALRRTARRYSICAADADDAYQRALEILLVKAPPGEARELVRWMQTVTKHEALAVRRSRERQLSPPPPPGGAHEDAVDWLSLIPSGGDGPAERAERREDIARSREALKTLKPAELKALTLLAEGYSYAEIGEMTGFSRTKLSLSLFPAWSSGLRLRIGRNFWSYPAIACSLITGSIQ
jgi:RNA polymerase sigma factor (sigma-70 family)